MFLQILPGRGLPMWMPEPQSGIREDRLRVRRCLQVRSCLHLQAFVSNSNRAAYCTHPKRFYRARANTRPNCEARRTSPFGVLLAGSFTLPTIGYAGAAWSRAHVAVLAP